MKRSRIKFDDKALKRADNDEARRLAAHLTRMLYDMAEEYEGYPVEKIKPVLES